jgi:hypothetical protein
MNMLLSIRYFLIAIILLFKPFSIGQLNLYPEIIAMLIWAAPYFFPVMKKEENLADISYKIPLLLAACFFGIGWMGLIAHNLLSSILFSLHTHPTFFIQSALWTLAFTYLDYLLTGTNIEIKIMAPLLFFAGYFFFITWVNHALSNFPLNFFDGSLGILPWFYFKAGLSIYREFGIPHSPGEYWLFGKLITFHSLAHNTFAMAIFRLVLSGGVIFLLSKITAEQKKFWSVLAFYLLLNTAIIGTVTLVLFSLLFLFSLYYLQNKDSHFYPLLILSLGNFCALLFRWEFAVFWLILNFIILLAAYFFRALQQDNFQQKMKKIVLAQFLGVTFAILTIVIYAWHAQCLKLTFACLFDIPVIATLPYRKGPFPIIVSLFQHDTTFYLALLVFLVICVFLIQYFYRSEQKRKNAIFLLLLAFPLAFLPYASGRADAPHAFPFAYEVGIILVAATVLNYLDLRKFLLLGVALLLPLSQEIFNPYLDHLFPTKVNQLQVSIDSSINDCKTKSAKLQYRSIFVGRLSYNKYEINSANLYLINTNVPPATTFIFEDPGLQDSCYYGQIIATQLKMAPKPILSFLELGDQPSVPQKANSCLKIEGFLQKNAFKFVGTCHANGQKYLIRLYE